MSNIKRHSRKVRAMTVGLVLIVGSFGNAPLAAGAGRSTTIALMTTRAPTAHVLSRPQQELAAIAAGRNHRQL